MLGSAVWGVYEWWFFCLTQDLDSEKAMGETR